MIRTKKVAVCAAFPGWGVRSIVISALGDFQTAFHHAIHQPVFAIDAAGPPPGIIAAKGFRLAQAFEGMPTALFYQPIDLGEYGFVALLPTDILLESTGQKDDVHSRSIASNSSIVLDTTPSPAFNGLIALSRAALFAGLAVR